MPAAARQRCQDPGRLFICRSDQKRHTGPPAPPALPENNKPAHNGPVIFTLCLCKALSAFMLAFMLYRYVYPSTPQNAPQRPTEARKAISRHADGISPPRRDRQRGTGSQAGRDPGPGRGGKQGPRPAQGEPGIVADSRWHSR